MSRHLRVPLKVLDLLIIFMMVFSAPVGVLAAPQQNPLSPSLISDKGDYLPGSTVLLTGTGFQPNETVHIFVNDDSSNTWKLDSGLDGAPADPTADAAGGFTYSFQLPNWFVANYTATATGLQSGASASVPFTDNDTYDWAQCKNDVGGGSPLSGGSTNDNKMDYCQWVNGNLGSSNSIYTEGDVVPQRAIRTVAAAGAHSITFDHSFYQTSGGAYTYDFLATADVTLKGLLAACNDVPATGNFAGLNNAGCLTLLANKTVLPLPDESTWTIGATNYTQPHLADAVANAALDGVTRNLWISCGYVSGGTMVSSPCTGVNLTILGHGASNGSLLSSAQQTAALVDSYTQMKVDFTTSQPDSFVVIWFGGHLAKTSFWNSLTDGYKGPGAAGASGSSFHERLIADESGSVGNRDNQLQSGVVVPPGVITIVKDDTSNSSTPFSFTASAPLSPSNFTLCDPAVTGCPTSQSFSSLPTGSYTFNEVNVPSGWTLNSISCSGGTSSFSYSSSGTTISLQPGDNVTCTFTNNPPVVQKKDLTVSKTATATFGRSYQWLIDKSVDKTQINIADGGSATFNYKVDVTPNGYTDGNWAVNGKITVANSNAFAISGVNVTDAIDNGGTCTVTNGTNVTVPANSSVVLDYSCSYAAAPSPAAGTNTATATWDKAAYFTPNGSGNGTASVDFGSVTPTETNRTITVVDNKTTGTNVTLGTSDYVNGPFEFTYSLTKLGVGGTCTDYTNTAKISETGQSDSQKVTVCVGKDLSVSKTAAGTFDRAYTWKISKSVDQTQVNIADGGSATFHYTVVAEQTGVSESGWSVSGKISLTNPNDWEAITLTSLTDAVDNGGLCTVDPGPYMVPKNGSLDVNYSCSYASAPSSFSGTNTATASWDAATYSTPSGSSAGFASFTMTQAGAANQTIHVTDSFAGDLGTVTATDSAPFASKSFTYDRTESGTAGTCTKYDNTATITETSQSASASATLCVGADLTVTKTASGTFDRAYQWQISKDADKTSVNIASGGTASFKYTVNVTQTGVSDGGWTLSGKITITNPNDWEAVTLTGLTDSVDNGGSCTLAGGPYVVPASGSLDVSYTCSYASAPGSYSGTNTATATWDKAAAFTPSGSANGSASFTLSQNGSSNKTVTVTDTLGGTLGTVTATDAAPFASKEFTYKQSFTGVGGKCTTYDNIAKITETGQSASKTVTVCVGLDLTVSKTANPAFTRTYTWGISKDVDKTQINVAGSGTATFNYTVNVTHDAGTDSGWTVTGKITVSNPNDWEAITVDVTDAVDNGGTCSVTTGTGVSIPASGSQTFDYTCTYATAPSKVSGTNTATATWDKTAASTPTGSASGTAGFNFNTPTTLVDETITVTDSLKGNLGTATYTDPSPTTFNYAITFPGVGGTCKTFDNTATFTTNDTGTTGSASQTVKVCAGLDLRVSKTATPTFTRTYVWGISKNVDKTQINIADGGTAAFNYTVDVTHDGGTDSGWKVTGQITVSNPNNWEDITANVTDALDTGACTVTGGTNVVIAARSSVMLDYTCDPASASATKNTATATWDKAAFFTPNGSASGSADVAFTTPTTIVDGSVAVTDTLGGSLGTVSYTDPSPKSFTYSKDFKGDLAGTCTNHNNTATFTTNTSGTTSSASKSVKVCVGKDLTVSKTATPAFTRTYLWNISKSVDKTQVTLASGSATFNYTVQVNQTGIQDSAWKVTGVITVNNPNDWEAVTVNVTDAVDNGGSCTVPSGTGVSIPAGGSQTFNYTCTFTSGASGINTATASWDKTAASTPTGSASGTAGFSFTTPTTTVNKTITVTDSFNGGAPVNIGTIPGVQPTTSTVTAADTQPYASQTWKYSRSIAAPDAACKSYTNTARIVETGQSASQTVTVCKASLITDTMLCSLTNNQFKLVYTPDQQSQGAWKLNASNPGQYYYNMFYSGPGNVDLTITLPYPWITQGAVPGHVYSSVGVNTTNGTTCLTPGTEIAGSTFNPIPVTLGSYGTLSNDYHDFSKTTTVTVHVPPTPSGFAYINLHLDYGLKGTTGYAKDANNNAVKAGSSTIVIPDLQTYNFTDTGGGNTTITSTNSFKKDPGIGGLVLKANGDAVKNAKVIIYDSSGKALATVYSDEDGWYMWQYKWTGKAATFTVKMWPYSPYSTGLQTQSVSLKANGYLVVNFTLP